METSNCVFLLRHSYEYDIGDWDKAEEIKFLGVFSTEEKGKDAIEYYKVLPGFRDYPEDCFHLGELELDRNYNWAEGFVKVSDDEDEE